MDQQMTGYPSIDKPWKKIYSKVFQNAPNPNCSMLEFLHSCNRDNLTKIALNYFGKKITYGKLFEYIDQVAFSLRYYGVKQGDIVSVCPLNTPEFIYLLRTTCAPCLPPHLGTTAMITHLVVVRERTSIV